MQSTRDRLKAYLVHPEVSAFLDALDAFQPERTPDPATPVREIDQDIGRRDLVRTLVQLREEARRNMLENPIVHGKS